jgi:hypothetical protein
VSHPPLERLRRLRSQVEAKNVLSLHSGSFLFLFSLPFSSFFFLSLHFRSPDTCRGRETVPQWRLENQR